MRRQRDFRSAPRPAFVSHVMFHAFLGLCVFATLVSPSAAEEYTVNLVGDAFDPQQIVIQAGDTIRWINDGGSNNVVSDGLFYSGNMSTDLWQYTYRFAAGGVYNVYSERNPNVIRSRVTVEGIFLDDFNDGHLTAWDGVFPERPDCVCYFSSDCADDFCNYGPGGFFTEDICNWVDGKPNGVPGTGCNLPHNGPWGGEICDGVCGSALDGSVFGLEDPDLLREGIALWAEAVLVPAEEGGGPLHAGFVEQVEQLGFEQPGVELILGRQVTDILILTGGQELYDYFCHHEQHPEAPNPALWVDFSGQPCRAAIARLTIDALLAAIDGHDVKPALLQVPAQCAEWSELIAEDCRGPQALACIGERISGMAQFMTTPPRSAGWR